MTRSTQSIGTRKPGRYAAASTSSNESRALERRALNELASVRSAVLSAVSASVKKNKKFKLGALSSLMGRLHTSLTEMSTAAYFLGQYRARKEIAKFAPDLKLSLLSDTLATLRTVSKADVEHVKEQYGESTAYVIRTLTTDLEDKVRNAVSKSIADGLHVNASITRALSAASGVFNAQTIVRTHIQLAYQAAKYLEYQDPFVNAGIWGYEYITVGDDRVRDEHAAMDGMRLPKDDPRWSAWWPPNGYNCRCSVLPIFTDEADLATPKQPLDGARPDEGWEFTPNQVTAIPDVHSKPVIAPVPVSNVEPKSKPKPKPKPEPKPGTVVPTPTLTDEKTQTEFSKVMAKASAEFKKSLNAEQRAAFKLYTDEKAYAKMNEQARVGKLDSMTPKLKAAFAEINQQINEKGVELTGSVFRGMRLTATDYEKFVKDLETQRAENKQIELNGLTSTSTSIEQGFSFAQAYPRGVSDQHSVLFEIKAKKGLPVEKLSGYRDEKEVLLAHGSKFKVLAVRKEELDFIVDKRITGAVDKKVDITIIELEQE